MEAISRDIFIKTNADKKITNTRNIYKECVIQDTVHQITQIVSANLCE